MPSYSYSPDPPGVGVEACVTVTFDSPPGSNVTITVTDDTTNPPTVIGSREFTGDPYKLYFTPDNAGAHTTTVTWRNGQSSDSNAFTVQ